MSISSPPIEYFTEPSSEVACKTSSQYIHNLNNSIVHKIASGQFAITSEQLPLIVSTKDNKNKQSRANSSMDQNRSLHNKVKQLREEMQQMKYMSVKQVRQKQSPENIKKRIKRIQKQQKERRQQYEAIKQRQLNKSKQKQLRQIYKSSQLRESLLKSKRLSIEQSLKKLNQNALRRQSVDVQTNRRVKSVLNNQRSNSKQMSQYDTKKVEQYRIRMEEMKKRYKPMNLTQFEQHEQKVQQYIKQRADEWKIKNKTQKRSIPKLKISYESKYRKSQDEANLELSQLDLKIKQHNKQKLTRMKCYADTAQQAYKPKISHKIESQIQKQLKRERQYFQNIQRKKQQSQKLIKIKGQQYLEHIKSLPKRSSKPSLLTEVTTNPEQRHYQNYLVHTERNNYNKWDNLLLKSTNAKQAAQKIKYQSQRIQDELKRKQQKNKLSHQIDYEQTDKMDEQYYNMMKAKLSVLQLN